MKKMFYDLVASTLTQTVAISSQFLVSPYLRAFKIEGADPFPLPFKIKVMMEHRNGFRVTTLTADFNGTAIEQMRDFEKIEPADKFYNSKS